MNGFQILAHTYFNPLWALDAVAQMKTPRFGAVFVFVRGVLVSSLLYLPFYLLKFEPITPAHLKIFDTPNYFLYAVFVWPLFIVLSWVYLSGVVYVALRLLNYPVAFDPILNLSGLLSLAIGIVLLVFDWITVAFGIHQSAYFMGIAHVIIADPWPITLSAIFYRKYFGVPVGLSVLLGILVRCLYIPIAILFIRT